MKQRVLCVCVYVYGGEEGGGSCLEGTIVKEKLCQNPGIEQFVVCVQLHLSHFNLSKPQSTEVEKQEMWVDSKNN